MASLLLAGKKKQKQSSYLFPQLMIKIKYYKAQGWRLLFVLGMHTMIPAALHSVVFPYRGGEDGTGTFGASSKTFSSVLLGALTTSAGKNSDRRLNFVIKSYYECLYPRVILLYKYQLKEVTNRWKGPKRW
jgi:hypothetical protein